MGAALHSCTEYRWKAAAVATLLVMSKGLALAGGVDDNDQCVYQFRASGTLLALGNQTLVDYGGVVLTPGDVLAVYFEDMDIPLADVNITGASLFVMPTFHTSSSATLEVAVAPSSIYDDGERASDTPLQGVGGLQPGYVPQNASDLISRGTLDGWSISDFQSAEGSVIWETCRYYEVGHLQEGAEGVISNAFLVDGSTSLEIYLRHYSGQNAFIEGNDDTYVNNMVLQIRSDRGCNQSTASDSYASPSSSGHVVNSFWSDDSSGLSGARNTVGAIQNGQRHPKCGGEYLNDCDFGPYDVEDIADGSCQQHLNTEGCHYDGGDCCSISCGRASTEETPYSCQGEELDRYFCRDPEYAVDFSAVIHGQYSVATTVSPFPKSTRNCQAAQHSDLSHRWCGLKVLASLTTITVAIATGIDALMTL